MLARAQRPQYLLRMGSHAERFYFEWARDLFDALILNANLVEGTPAACLSLVEALTDKPYVIDPVSHAFALPPTYLQSTKANKRTGEITVSTKRTFSRLGTRYGEPFAGAVGRRAIVPEDMDDATVRRRAVENVLVYQRDRLEEARPESGPLRVSTEPIRPAVLVAPYFFVDYPETWLSTNLAMMNDAVALEMGLPIYAVLAIDRSFLQERDRLVELAKGYCKTKVDGFFIWVSDLPEATIGRQELRNLIGLVEILCADARPIYNLYGGYLSVLLSAFGMAGLSHGVCYGEHRNILPVLGGGVPPARYYLPPLHQAFVFPDAQSILRNLSTEEYYHTICNCPVCQSVIGNDFQGNFQQFGETELKGFDKRGHLRFAQTANSVRICRGHYLVARFLELQRARTDSISDLVSQLRNAGELYRNPSGLPATGYLRVWADEVDAHQLS